MAKSMMQRADVPVVPGYHGGFQDLETLLEAAQGVGFPLLVKAAMGGGGKGMKLATHPDQVEVQCPLGGDVLAIVVCGHHYIMLCCYAVIAVGWD